MSDTTAQPKKKRKMLTSFSIIFILLALVAIISILLNGTSFHYEDIQGTVTGATLGSFTMASVNGFKDAVDVCLFVMVLGGFLGIVNKTDALATGIDVLVAKMNGNELKLIAIDGFRLAVRKENIDYSGDDISFIVPAKTLSEIMKLMNEDDSTISLGVGKRHIVFEIGSYSVVSRLLEGEFLNYESAIPPKCTTRVKVNTRDMINSIDRASLIISEKYKSPIKCVFADNMIRLSSVTSLGTASDSVSAEIDGDDVEIGFNNKYLTDALRVADTDEVRFKLNGPISPIIILPPDGDSFLFLVLPVRIKTE